MINGLYEGGSPDEIVALDPLHGDPFAAHILEILATIHRRYFPEPEDGAAIRPRPHTREEIAFAYAAYHEAAKPFLDDLAAHAAKLPRRYLIKAGKLPDGA